MLVNCWSKFKPTARRTPVSGAAHGCATGPTREGGGMLLRFQSKRPQQRQPPYPVPVTRQTARQMQHVRRCAATLFPSIWPRPHELRFTRSWPVVVSVAKLLPVPRSVWQSPCCTVYGGARCIDSVRFPSLCSANWSRHLLYWIYDFTICNIKHPAGRYRVNRVRRAGKLVGRTCCGPVHWCDLWTTRGGGGALLMIAFQGLPCACLPFFLQTKLTAAFSYPLSSFPSGYLLVAAVRLVGKVQPAVRTQRDARELLRGRCQRWERLQRTGHSRRRPVLPQRVQRRDGVHIMPR